MKHGPIALIDRTCRSWALVFGGALYEKMMTNIEEARARDGAIIAVTDEASTEVQRRADRTIACRAPSDLADAHLGCRPPAAPRLPHRPPAWLRRGSASQPRQVGHR